MSFSLKIQDSSFPDTRIIQSVRGTYVPVGSGYGAEGSEPTASGNTPSAFALPAKLWHGNSNDPVYRIPSYSASDMETVPKRNTNLEDEQGDDYPQWPPTEYNICVVTMIIRIVPSDIDVRVILCGCCSVHFMGINSLVVTTVLLSRSCYATIKDEETKA